MQEPGVSLADPQLRRKPALYAAMTVRSRPTTAPSSVPLERWRQRLSTRFATVFIDSPLSKQRAKQAE
jgi:hypothetical protein